jgi:UDP-N-acetylmuramate dehydrogenase
MVQAPSAHVLTWPNRPRSGTLILMGQMSTASISHDVSLAPLTTLELGGTAESYVEVENVAQAAEAIRWARRQNLPLAVIGGGSNLVVADGGWPGLALRAAMRGIELEPVGGAVRLTAAAGEPWDDVVAETVAGNLAGLECLSGIPGWVGATPIQNVGAYGQDVATVIESVCVLNTLSLEQRNLSNAECRFGYRTSAFREFPGRDLVISVTYLLRQDGPPTIEYRELRRALGARRAAASLADVRLAVLELRRGKSMVVEKNDTNRRSVGSFFVNPIFDAVGLGELEHRARAAGVLDVSKSVPTFPAGPQRFKVSAAWLIEHSGFARGTRRGAFGISSAHALALVHHGGGSTDELLSLARDIREGVRHLFGVELQPEPFFLGFETANPLDR